MHNLYPIMVGKYCNSILCMQLKDQLLIETRKHKDFQSGYLLIDKPNNIFGLLGPLLLTWINFNPSMHK